MTVALKNDAKRTLGVRGDGRVGGSYTEHSIKENPFITVSGITEFVSKSCNVWRSRSCVSNYMSRIGISRKKAFRSVNYSHDLGTVSRFCTDLLATEEVVCIDEAGFYLGDHGKYIRLDRLA